MYDARQYVRMVGLKLFLLAVSFAVVAAAVPGGQPLEDASWGGMKLLHLVVGTMGAGASLFFLPQFSGLALGRTVTCGILAAVIGTPFLTALYIRYIGVPVAGAENVVAGALGVGGVYILPGAQALLDGFKTNPWGFIDRLRGRGAPPSGPDQSGGPPQ